MCCSPFTNYTSVAHFSHCLQPLQAVIVNYFVVIILFCVLIICSVLFTLLHIADSCNCVQSREVVTTNIVSDCHPGKLQPYHPYRRLSSSTDTQFENEGKIENVTKGLYPLSLLRFLGIFDKAEW